MANVSSKWKHWKWPKRIYRGTYIYVLGEREFRLIAGLKNGKLHSIPFESPKAAYENEWRRIKARKTK